MGKWCEMTKAQIGNIWEDSRLRGFLGAINRRCGIVETLALPTMRDLPPVKIETLFVPPLLSKEAVSADSDPGSWPAGKSLLEELESSPRLVVLGDPGGGKTTLSNWVAWRLTSGLTAPLPNRLLNVIPLPCVLREIPHEYLKEAKNIYEITCFIARKILGEERAEQVIPVLSDWVKAGRFILILDGIDEIPIESRAAVASWIKEAKDKKACVLATSRIVGYNDYPVDSPSKESQLRKDMSEKVIKRIDALAGDSDLAEVTEKAVSSWAELRYLMPFDKNQVADFVRNWYRQRCTSDNEAKEKTLDLLGALKDSEVTSKLARTPNLLSLMAVVHRERAHLPDGKALLYEEIVNAYLNTIDSQRKIIQDDTLGNYTWRDKKAWISYVGFMMQSARTFYSREGILASEKQVLSWLAKAMRQSKVVDAEAVAIEFLSWVARRSGLLLPRGEGYYAFVHLSFQEYFCACHIESSVVSPEFFNTKIKSKAAVSPADFLAWANESHWLETLIFVFEILSSERNSSWINSLVGSIYVNFPKMVPVNDEFGRLAARLLTNKHVKLGHQWINYLADISSVMVYRMWDEQSSHVVMSAFVSLGYALVIDDADVDEIDSRRRLPRFSVDYDSIDKSKVRIFIYRASAPLESAFLAGFTRVFVLDCEDCEYVDISEFDSKYLTALSVQDSALKGGERINEFKALQSLQLARVRQEGMENTKGNSNITDALLCDVNLSSLNFVAGWKKLYSLDITSIDVSDVSFLKALKEISYLTLERAPVEDVSALSSLKKLEFLSLAHCPIEFIPKLKVLGPLSIALRSLKVSSFDFLADVKYFTGGVVGDCPVTTLRGLASPALSYLYLDKLPLISWDGLEELDNLRSVVVRDIDCPDFSKFSTLKNLTGLRVYDTPIKDLKWAKGLRHLRHLLLCDTLIRDLTPLVNMKRLSDVVINKVEGLELAGLEEHPTISLSVRDRKDIR